MLMFRMYVGSIVLPSIFPKSFLVSNPYKKTSYVDHNNYDFLWVFMVVLRKSILQYKGYTVKYGLHLDSSASDAGNFTLFSTKL